MVLKVPTMYEPRIMVRSRALAMELFAGAGGMSQGFVQAGFEIVQAIEVDRRAAETYKNNHGRTDLIVDDVCQLDALAIARRIALQRAELFVIIGGPPCQGFSESNRRTRDLDNPKNALYRQFFPLRCSTSSIMVCFGERSWLENSRQWSGYQRNHE